MQEGQLAPDLEIAAANLETILPGSGGTTTLKLSDLRGRNVVLFFFPWAMTPTCTAEACAFRDWLAEFKQLDAVVLGVSTDSLVRQRRFTDKKQLNFPLLADSDKKIARQFGVLNLFRLARRWTFVIDKAGTIRKIFTKVSNAKNHPAEVLEFLKSMKGDSP
jgi:thioredoxin-dependent peroxiredoxin